MTAFNIPRIVIAGTNSGVGKTTVVTGLLAALRHRGLAVQSYKIGPDYIDPGFHSLASGKPSHNLDTWLVPNEKVAPIFAKTAVGNDIAVIEGVMGLYDGGRGGISSTAAVAKLLHAPVILVIDAKSMGESAAAMVLGYKDYDPELNFAGVIVNRLGSSSHRKMVCDAIENLGVPVIGAIHRNDDLKLPERHLGLTPVSEINPVQAIGTMAKQLNREVDIEQILEIAGSTPALHTSPRSIYSGEKKVKIGVARDEVFNFYYPASLDTLEDCGAELVFFSPLKDVELPDVDGLLLGGGFPEMFVDQLANNISMKNAIYRAWQNGMPVYAECGGLMYLCRQIVDFNGKAYDMAGLIPATSIMEHQLQTVGYIEAESVTDNVLAEAGQVLRGHEFHFSRMLPDKDDQNFPWAFTFRKMRTGAVYHGGFVANNILASYLHLHFAGHEEAALRYIDQCRTFNRKKQVHTEREY